MCFVAHTRKSCSGHGVPGLEKVTPLVLRQHMGEDTPGTRIQTREFSFSQGKRVKNTRILSLSFRHVQ